MSVIVTDAGFVADDLDPGDAGTALDLAADADLSQLAGQLDRLRLICIAFPTFADGRGFTLARRLRLLGYRGRLRAVGPLIADQYAMARRVGFDEVEIPDDLAARQGEQQWMYRANWRGHDYRGRLCQKNPARGGIG